jgi:hypothetical protein
MYTFRSAEGEETNIPLVYIDKTTMTASKCVSVTDWQYIVNKLSPVHYDIVEFLTDTVNMQIFLFYASESFLSKLRRRLSAKLSKLLKEKDIVTLRQVASIHIAPCMKPLRDQIVRARRLVAELEVIAMVEEAPTP